MLKKLSVAMKENKAFMYSFVNLLIPITLQNLVGYALNMADTVMVGFLGESHLSAISLANQPFNILWCAVWGLISGGSILISQYWGKQDTKSINRITGFILLMASLFSLFFSIATGFFPEFVMGFYSNDPVIIAYGVDYLRIISLSYLVTGISNTFLCVLRCTEQAKGPLLINCFSLGLNTLLNYILIFGKFGAPALGVKGAAIATVIARLAEFISAILFTFVLDKRKIFKVKYMVQIRLNIIKEYVKYGLPAFLNDFIWGIGISGHSMILGRLGATAVAAYTATNLAERFAFIIINGFGAAAAVIIGKELGAGNITQTKKYCKYIIRIAISLGTIIAGLCLLLIPIFLKLFNFADETIDVTKYMILIMSLLIIVKSMNYTITMAFLRSGGEAKISAIVDNATLFFISLPLGFLAAFIFKLPVYVVYLALMTDELSKVIYYYKYYKSYKWAKNITKQLD